MNVLILRVLACCLSSDGWTFDITSRQESVSETDQVHISSRIIVKDKDIAAPACDTLQERLRRAETSRQKSRN
ncbi:hypothetical protein BS17DRAFT_778911 [Gyrodon lividus]|nr:hypothetical protein BS17DRAFT_778911 [Gyrodon lividus]